MSSDSTLSAEALYKEANELILNDEFEQALNTYSAAIKKCDKSNSNDLYTYLIGRSQAHLKLKNNQDALNDADQAISLNQNDFRAYLKKGIALYNLKEYEKALDSLLDGQKKAEKETDAIKKLFNDWINKSKKEIPVKEKEPEQVKPETKSESKEENSDDEDIKSELKTLAEPQPQLPPPIKHEWYQTVSQVIVTILAKNVTQDDLDIVTEEKLLSVVAKDQEKFKIQFKFNLLYSIVPEQTQIKFMSTKIEIKLNKTEAITWSKLEASPNDIVVKKAVQVEQEKKPEYPTSSKKPKNWDKIVADVVAEEKDEKLEGDGALNRLFKQIYENGSDEVRKAMNKSFTESGGTVLSTNWGDVGAKKLEVNPPDGLEWKKWD